jgi:serine/threonine protein kinase/Tol biopolymer transport system component/DNA-binding winged helix-turn-helix (wHTH) protein
MLPPSGHGGILLTPKATKETSVSSLISFGAFELDLRARELRKHGLKIRLPEQSIQVLAMLLERPGQVVLREEIQKKLWPNDTIVEFDHSINAAVKRLRRAPGDEAETPHFVETLPRRGYRFIYLLDGVAPVAEQAQDQPIAMPAFPTDGPGASVLPGSVSNSSSLIGTTVSHYRVLSVVGTGGMGVVYKAQDIRLGRLVALKFLPEELAGDPRALERFEREARAASTLNHPNICTIYEVEEQDGKPFIVMELLEGETVRERLVSRTASGLGGPGVALRIEELVMFAIQIADGLDAAHRKGIIHRDIKPANIFITREGQVKILDFGVAKLADSALMKYTSASEGPATLAAHETPTASAGREHLTREGAMMGTASYMSPEQIRGENIDARTDLFSFGLVLYEMATGRQAFSGTTTVAIQDAILNQAPIPLAAVNPKLSRTLEEIINKALEKDRDLRYHSAGDLGADLKRLKRETDSARGMAVPAEVKAGQRQEAVPSGTWDDLARPRIGARRQVLHVSIPALVVLAALAWYLWHRSQSNLERNERQITTNSSELTVWASAISPDGRYLAYSDETGIHLKVVGTAEAHALPAPAGSRISRLAWFRDGSKLLASGAAIEPGLLSLWTVSILGGTPQKLRDDAADGSVFENGSGIVFLSGEGKEIWQMSSGGEAAQKMITAPEGESFAMPLVAKGRLWYERLIGAPYSGFEYELESRDLKGGPPAVLASSLDDASSYLLLPNRRLIYSRRDRPELFLGGSLWSVQADLRTGLPRGQVRRIATWPDFEVSGLSGTADGARLAFLKENTEQFTIYVGDLEGNGLRIVNARRLTLSDSVDEAYAWTPDGESVLFDSNRNGTWDIFRQALDQRTAERLVAEPGGSMRPAMAPDGMSVLYLTPSQPIRIMRVALRGGPPQSLGELPSAGEIRCARVANFCAVSASDSKRRVLYALDPAKGKGRELLRTDPAPIPGEDEDWDVSPDGSSLAFIKSDAQGRSFQIQVRPLTGGARPKLIDVNGWGNNAGFIRWAADGKGWYVTASSISGWRLYASISHLWISNLLKVDPTGKATRVLQGTTWGDVIPSPDGHHVAFIRQNQTSNVWMLENF